MDWDSAWEKIGSKFKNLTEGGLSDIPSNLFKAGKNIFESFQDGLDEGVKSVISHILNFGAEIINASICNRTWCIDGYVCSSRESWK